MAEEKVTIVIPHVVKFLHEGVTRYKDDSNYNEERGSIQEKYNLSKAEVKELFAHPMLKNVRVKVPKESRLVLIEQEVEGSTETPIVEPESSTTTTTEETSSSEVTKEESQEKLEETETLSEGDAFGDF